VEFDRFDVYDCLVDAVVDDVNHANQDDARSDLMGRKQQQSLYLYEVKKTCVTTYHLINTKNCSLSIVLTATDQKPQKSLKR